MDRPGLLSAVFPLHMFYALHIMCRHSGDRSHDDGINMFIWMSLLSSACPSFKFKRCLTPQRVSIIQFVQISFVHLSYISCVMVQ